MSHEVKSLNGKCGILGVWGHPDAASAAYFGLHSLQHRGQEDAGIVSDDRGKLMGHRDLGLPSEVFKDQRKLQQLIGEAAIGHVRYAAASNRSVDDIQPFLLKFHNQSIDLAHNGNLIDARSLRKELEGNGAIFHPNSDTEILMYLTRRSEEIDFLNKLESALDEVRGGFAYLLMAETAMIATLDLNGFHPLTAGQIKNGAYMITSETCASEVIGARFIRDVQPGKTVIINDERIQIDCFMKDTQLSICSVEYIYFARPDSNIAGVNVHTARENMGRNLAKESPIRTDMIVDVPDSSLSAADGYARVSSIPYEIELVKNQYIARALIQLTPGLREQGIRTKLSAVHGVMEGKKMIMVGDSIVQDTTSRRIVHLLKEVGAEEVHVRIASLPLKYPCFYRIDTQTCKELIAANHAINGIKECIGADSLSFLSEKGLTESIGLEEDAPYSGLCTAYFSGDHPTPSYGYEEKYQESLKEEVPFF